MKLFTRYSRINILVIIAIFLVSATALFFSINYVMLQQVDESLRIEEGEVMTYTRQYGHVPQSMTVKDQLTHIVPAPGPVVRRYTTTRFTEPGDVRPEDFRQLTFSLQTDGQWYRVTVSKSLEDMDMLTHSILIISIVTILILLTASFIINRLLLRRLWKDFYRSLEAVGDFKVGSGQPLQLPVSQIVEFSFMNANLERLTQQARADYHVLKTLSENASHELQTPIAIIRSKLDLLIQDEHLSEEQSQAVQSANNAVQRLVQLNQSLLLLARIGNHQYDDVSRVQLDAELSQKLTDFQELWQAQQIRVQPQLRPAAVRMNTELSHILLNNLLSNATRHNCAGGTITIVLDEQSLEVSNTSQVPALDDRVIFQRFYKGAQSTQNNGLGLSIVRQICEVSGFSIHYRFEAGRHCFRVSFAPGS